MRNVYTVNYDFRGPLERDAISRHMMSFNVKSKIKTVTKPETQNRADRRGGHARDHQGSEVL